ncbi:MAG: hypothetical protein ACFFCJ_02530 [Promethearchaeota archaeon]
MELKAKRYLIIAIVIILIVVFAVLGYELLGPYLCQDPCVWTFPGWCWCPQPGAGTPQPPEIYIPEGIPGFPPAALLLSVVIAVLLVLMLRRQKQQ